MSAWTCIGLGGNVGTQEQILARFRAAAVDLEEHLQCRLLRSAVYRSRAVGPVADQPPFLNGVVGTRDCALGPADLVELALRVEAIHARDRQRETPQGPRTLDLDVLVAGDATANTATVVVPHPRLWDRRFALQPLADVVGPSFRAPGWTLELGARLSAPTIAAQAVNRLADSW